MKTINFTEFRKQYKNSDDFETVQINPYFNLEGWSSKTIYISDRVSEVTEITYRRVHVGLIIPKSSTVKDSLQPHYQALVNILRVDAPVISVFTPDGRKITQLSKPNNS